MLYFPRLTQTIMFHGFIGILSEIQKSDKILTFLPGQFLAYFFQLNEMLTEISHDSTEFLSVHRDSRA